jgi:hypothetical protein
MIRCQKGPFNPFMKWFSKCCWSCEWIFFFNWMQQPFKRRFLKAALMSQNTYNLKQIWNFIIAIFNAEPAAPAANSEVNRLRQVHGHEKRPEWPMYVWEDRQLDGTPKSNGNKKMLKPMEENRRRTGGWGKGALSTSGFTARVNAENVGEEKSQDQKVKYEAWQ